MAARWRLALWVLAVVFCLGGLQTTSGQSVTVLHTFEPGDGSAINSGGSHPTHLVLYQGRFYGVANSGGAFALGVIFSMNPDGSDFKMLHSFDDVTDPLRRANKILVADEVIYGLLPSGGDGAGALFAMEIDGKNYRYVHEFFEEHGEQAACELTLEGDTLFGVAPRQGVAADGAVGEGTVFAVGTNGLNFRVLHTFSSLDAPKTPTSAAAAIPEAGLTLDANVLYGTTAGGGRGAGTVFKVNVDGSGFAVLHDFAAPTYDGATIRNADGALSFAKMVVVNGKLYGAASYGGPSGSGVFYRMNKDGSQFAVVHSFPATSLRREAAHPFSLLAVGNRLYGGGADGGAFGYGALFQVDVVTGAYKTLYNFPQLDLQSRNIYGATPTSPVVATGGKMHYAAFGGGSGGTGTLGVLGLEVPAPRLDITKTDTGVRIVIFGEVGVDYTLERAESLPGSEWAGVMDVSVSQVPQAIDVPAPGVSTYWRARVR